MVTLLIFIIILTVLVLIHELGHFLVAKKLGIKIEEFGFGLPPRAFGKKIGETIYSINWLPIGGFVKLYGEDESGAGRVKIRNPKSEIRKSEIGRAFFARPPLQRGVIVVAGVVMNLLLAIVIFYAFIFISNFKTELPLFDDHKFFGVTQINTAEIIVSAVSKNSPAEKAGIKPFSKIEAVNGEKVKDAKQFLTIINKNKGKEVTVEWQETKTNKRLLAKLTPRLSPPKNEGAVGVGFFSMTKAALLYDTGVKKIFSGIVHPANLLVYNLKIMGKLIAVSFREKTFQPVGEGVAGPVGIYSLVGNIVQIPDMKEKVLGVLNLAGILSISLAFFNILPIPALDGGRLFFILIETVTRRKVHPKFEGYAHTIGMAVLLALIIFITLRDLQRLFR
ncbi:MAG: site-2 protease family protein [Candidatus Levybacteria bacterium]|nr:site-2 protease family protein [Candidatus Levybacteria bacterium]MBI3092893.1 site-2 protease family protein [Candidatus Levybacteria bacterium]